MCALRPPNASSSCWIRPTFHRFPGFPLFPHRPHRIAQSPVRRFRRTPLRRGRVVASSAARGRQTGGLIPLLKAGRTLGGMTATADPAAAAGDRSGTLPIQFGNIGFPAGPCPGSRCPDSPRSDTMRWTALFALPLFSGALGAAEQPFRLCDDAKHARLLSLIPKTDDPRMEAVRTNPRLIIYTDAEMPKAAQFWDAN